MDSNKIDIYLLDHNGETMINVDRKRNIIDTINEKLRIADEDKIIKQPYVFFGDQEIYHSETFSGMKVGEGARLTLKYPDPQSDFPFNSVALESRFNQVEPKMDINTLISNTNLDKSRFKLYFSTGITF